MAAGTQTQHTTPTASTIEQTTHHRDHQTPRQPRISCIRRVIHAIILSFIAISIVSTVTWLLLNPYLPTIRVDSVSVSNFNLSVSKLTANYEVGFILENPNKKISLEFEELKVCVSYKKMNPLLTTLVHPFNLGKMKQRVVKVELGTNPSYGFGGKEKEAIEMGREWRGKMVRFDVRMVGLVNFKASDWLSRHKTVDVLCDDLEVEFGSEEYNRRGELRRSAGIKYCSVYLV